MTRAKSCTCSRSYGSSLRFSSAYVSINTSTPLVVGPSSPTWSAQPLESLRRGASSVRHPRSSHTLYHPLCRWGVLRVRVHQYIHAPCRRTFLVKVERTTAQCRYEEKISTSTVTTTVAPEAVVWNNRSCRSWRLTLVKVMHPSNDASNHPFMHASIYLLKHTRISKHSVAIKCEFPLLL